MSDCRKVGLNIWIKLKIQEFQNKLFNANLGEEEILSDQGNDGHSETGTGHWSNP
jgi:hypothetical protein